MDLNLCWEPYVRTNSERERHFCHRLILGRLIAKHRPDLTVVVDELRCGGCSELYTDVIKAKLSRTRAPSLVLPVHTSVRRWASISGRVSR